MLRPRARAVLATGLAAAFVALAAPRALHAQDGGLAVGAKPEPVAIEDLDGNVVDLGQWVGKKPVVIEFWATWCPLCRALEPQLEAAKERWGDRVEVLFVGVGVNQTPATIRRHTQRHPMPGRVLWDGDGRAVRAFEAPSTSFVVVLDASGTVRYTGIGNEQDIVAAVARVMD